MPLTTEQLRAARSLAIEALDEEQGITPGPWEARSDGMTVRQVTPEDQPRGYRICITGRLSPPVEEIAQDVANLMWIESVRTREPQLAREVLALADAYTKALPVLETALERRTYYAQVRAGEHSERIFIVLGDADSRFEAALDAYAQDAPPVRESTSLLLAVREYLKSGTTASIQPPGSFPACRVMGEAATVDLLQRVERYLAGLPE